MAAFPEVEARRRRKELEGDYATFIDPLQTRLSLEEYGAAVERYRENKFGGTGGLAAAFDASIAFANEEQEVQRIQDERSPTARRTDRSKKAPMVLSQSAWGADPRRRDFPGVDTPRDADLLEELGGTPRYLDF